MESENLNLSDRDLAILSAGDTIGTLVDTEDQAIVAAKAARTAARKASESAVKAHGATETAAAAQSLAIVANTFGGLFGLRAQSKVATAFIGSVAKQAKKIVK